MSLPSTATDAPARLRLRHHGPIDFATAAVAGPEPLLGAALIGCATAELPSTVPLAHVALRTLTGGPCVEAWHVPALLGRGQHGAVRYAWSDEYLFGAIDPHAVLRASLEQTTRATYDALFAALAQTGFRYLLRAWNYMPAINRVAGEPGGLERYRQFNLGRAAAFVAAQAPSHEGAPAACALGTDRGDLTVYFLAMRRSPEPVENPRQVSAYRYPSQYGPHSPTFSRAALVCGSQGVRLFVSGTASIVGHRTTHGGDVAAQTRETLVNIDAVVAAARKRLGDPAALPLDTLAFKAYLRHAVDLPAVQREVTAALGAAADVLYLQADICRADLLVEIEAFG